MKLRQLAFIGLALIVGLSSGCGGNNPLAPANVSGVVNYKGKPLTGGTIKFVTSEGSPYAAEIGADGTYAVADIPTGELVIVVDTSDLDPEKKGAATSGSDAKRRSGIQMQQPPSGAGAAPGKAGDDRKYVKIPDKYKNPKTSPLSLTVKAGRQVHTVDLD